MPTYLSQNKVDIMLYFKVQGDWYCPINDKCQQKVKEQKHLCFVFEGYHEPNCVLKKDLNLQF